MKLFRGIILLETLIYSSIVAVFFGSVVVMAYHMIDAHEKTVAEIEVIENARFVEHKLRWALTGAANITTPSINTTSTVLDFQNAHSDHMIFDVHNGVLRLTTGNSAPIALTNSFVTVGGIYFENKSYSPQTKNTVHIRGTITDAQIPSRTFDINWLFSVQ